MSITTESSSPAAADDIRSLKHIDIVGDSWTSRYLAEHFLSNESKIPKKIRLWKSLPQSPIGQNARRPHRLALVPPALKHHKGLGSRLEIRKVPLYYSKRQ